MYCYNTAQCKHFIPPLRQMLGQLVAKVWLKIVHATEQTQQQIHIRIAKDESKLQQARVLT